MEPRSIERGKKEIRKIDCGCEGLQWSRDQLNAESKSLIHRQRASTGFNGAAIN